MQLPTLALAAELSVHFCCHPVPGLNHLLACSSSVLTSSQWCHSPGCHLPGLCPGGILHIGLPHLVLHSLVTHVGKICHNSNFLRTETQVLGGYVSKPRQDSSPSLWLYILMSMATKPAGFPFPVPLWSRIPGFVTTWSSSEKMSSTVCLSFILVNLTPETVACQVSQYAEIQGTLPFTNSLKTHCISF